MATLDERISLVAEQIFKRPLSDEEQLEIYRIVDILGMKDIQSYLHLILVLKLHENTMDIKFAEMAAIDKKIQDTLECSIERILGEGAEQIGADMGETIASKAKEVMSSVKDFYCVRGYIVATSITGIVATVAYWLGLSGALRVDEYDGLFKGVFLLPAGWWMFFSVASYTYFWFFDNRKLVKKNVYYKCVLWLLGVIMCVLFLSMI